MLLAQVLPCPSAKVSGSWLSTGQQGGGKPLVAGPEEEKPRPGPASKTLDIRSEELPPSGPIYREKTSEAPGRCAESGCQSKVQHRDKSAASKPPPGEEGSSIPGREGKMAKKSYVTAPSKQKKPSSLGLASTAAAAAVTSSASATHNPVPCGSGRGPCHLANLLNTLAQNNQNAEKRRPPPQVTCQIRKKTRTLYRSGKSQKGERKPKAWCHPGRVGLLQARCAQFMWHLVLDPWLCHHHLFSPSEGKAGLSQQ